MNKEITVEYKGETYPFSESERYAESLHGSEDFFPMYDAIRDADVAYLTEAGALFLKLVKQQNIFAMTITWNV